MYTVETKSMLAKLMASENIRVEHRTAKTASFNTETRTLICPIWKDMTGDIYDLMLGHEISHALNTPPEGWHDSIVSAGTGESAAKSEQMAFKHFLNVVEDARIEKLIKRQYPGLRRPMIIGYKEFLARDFFGLSAISDFNSLYLIDKLNLAAKCGTLVNIRFTSQEQPYYDALMSTETWEEVVALAKRLYDYSKTEQQQGEKKKQQLADQLVEDLEEGEQEEDLEEGEQEEDLEEGEQEEDLEEDEQEDPYHPEGEGDLDMETGGANEGGEGEGDFIPKAKTDEAFRNSEHKLVEQADLVTRYLNIPTPSLEHIVVPAEVVNATLTQAFSSHTSVGNALLMEFKKKNEDYIALLAKEFEMKKAADSYAKSKISDSGDIDINKLANYRLEDNIFRKTILAHKGKSHGLVLLLDKSSSMTSHIKGSIEQILVLAMFCRKVNIPFVAYGFTSIYHSYNVVQDSTQQWSRNPDDLSMNGCRMREIINSRMSADKFNRALANQLILAAHYVGDPRISAYWGSIPEEEKLHSTPLHQALVASRDLIRQFKRTHRLNIVNMVIVHDGEADSTSKAISSHDTRFNVPPMTYMFNERYERVTLLDTKENLSIPVPQESRGLTIALMKWVQLTTGCGIFGFYITGTSGRNANRCIIDLYQNKHGVALGSSSRINDNNADRMLLIDSLKKKLIEEKFLESFTSGYTRFYFIPGARDLEIPSSGIQDTGVKWTPSRLLTAYKKAGRKKHISRVLVTRFIDLIAV
jgi:uncharacterized protein YlaN (UPF0358 family)